MIEVRPEDHQVTFIDGKTTFLDLNEALTLVDVDHLKRVMAVHTDVMTAIVYVETYLDRECWVEVTQVYSLGIDNGDAFSVGVLP